MTTLDLAPLHEVAAGHTRQMDEMEALLTFRVDSPEEAQIAADLSRKVREAARAITSERDKALDPLDAAARTIRGWFDPTIKRCNSLIAHLKSEISTYQEAQRERQQAALKAIAETKGSREEIVAAVSIPTAPPAGVQERKQWTWELVDISQVPREFLCVDEKRVNAELRAIKDGLTIPGLRIFQKIVMVIK